MDLLERMVQAKRLGLPHYWCEPTCPRQATHQAKDCECMGAKLEFEAWREKQKRSDNPKGERS